MKKKGFSLTELTAALAVFGIILSVVLLSVPFGSSEREKVSRSAQRTAVWLKRRVSAASREGATFIISMNDRPGMSDHNTEITLIWYGGARDTERESYTEDETVLQSLSLKEEHRFDGRWHTMAPAVSFMVKSKKDPDIRLFVTVSGTGYIDIKQNL